MINVPGGINEHDFSGNGVIFKVSFIFILMCIRNLQPAHTYLLNSLTLLPKRRHHSIKRKQRKMLK